jgi:MFS family permease
MPDNRGFFAALVGDGRSLLKFTGLSLILAGLFAFFLSATGHFLPHDVHYLGMTPEELCAVNECRIVHFMIHDRVSFGGAILAVGVLYLWLAEFPLRRGEPWAWWLFATSGLAGFGSFLAYLGYGYLDTWHGAATLILLPCFLLGLVRSYRLIPARSTWRCLLESSRLQSSHHAPRDEPRPRERLGYFCLLATSAGLFLGGLIILAVGMTCVFVPQDLAFMGLSASELQAINPRLVPLIAHDRAGFGGGVATAGLLMFFCIRCGEPSRGLWQALTLAGFAGFATAVGVHPLIGYTDFLHLAPAVLGAAIYLVGLVLTYRPMMQETRTK